MLLPGDGDGLPRSSSSNRGVWKKKKERMCALLMHAIGTAAATTAATSRENLSLQTLILTREYRRKQSKQPKNRVYSGNKETQAW